MTRSAESTMRSLHGPARELVRKIAPRVVQTLLGASSAQELVRGKFADGMDGQPRHVLEELRPAAIRVERSHSVRGGDQTALTVWFGDGPSLPGPDGISGRSRGATVRLGAQVIGAIALSVATVLIGEWDRARRTQVIDAPSREIDVQRTSNRSTE
ncbi:MAG: hypothetical protein ACP5OR_01625 [Candidatus Dormibacteria bacterium]